MILSFCKQLALFPFHYRFIIPNIEVHWRVLFERSSSSADAAECYKLSIWDPSGQCSKINKPKSGLARPEYT